jgi:hypothetical protein
MKNKRNRLFKVCISLLLMIGFILPSQLTTSSAQAASKPSIESEMTINAGSIRGESFVYLKSDKQVLEVNNPVKKATYSFKSSNTGVVKLKASGSKVYLTGLKAGTSTITCEQKLSGKTTKVGTCKITVKAAEAYSESYDGMSLGTSKGIYVYYGYRNCDATYTFTSNSKNFTMKEVVEKEKGSKDNYLVQQSYTAKKAGTYTVTVKETYNKKTRTVGKFKFEVKKATVAEEYELYEEDYIGAFSLIYYSRGDVSYLFDDGDASVVEFYNGEDGGVYMVGKKPGTVTVKIYEDATKPDKSKLIGSCKVTVKELKLESLDYYLFDTQSYVGGSAIGYQVYKYPTNAPEQVTVTSSDPSVATVGEMNEDFYGEITPVGEGTATITITCGDITKTETIKIYADEDAMYAW